MSEHFICDIDIASMYYGTVNGSMPMYTKPEQVPWSKYESFAYKKSFFTNEYILFRRSKKFYTGPVGDELLSFSSKNALLLTCEIYGIKVKRVR